MALSRLVPAPARPAARTTAEGTTSARNPSDGPGLGPVPHAGPQRHVRGGPRSRHGADVHQGQPALVALGDGEGHLGDPRRGVLGRRHVGHGPDLHLQPTRAGLTAGAEGGQHQAVPGRGGDPNLRRAPARGQHLDGEADPLTHIRAGHELDGDPQGATAGLGLDGGGDGGQAGAAVELAVEAGTAAGSARSPTGPTRAAPAPASHRASSSRSVIGRCHPRRRRRRRRRPRSGPAPPGAGGRRSSGPPPCRARVRGSTTTGRGTPWALVWADRVAPGAGGGPDQPSAPTVTDVGQQVVGAAHGDHAGGDVDRHRVAGLGRTGQARGPCAGRR